MSPKVNNVTLASADALRWIGAHWDKPICRLTVAAKVIGCREATLKIRVKRGQAVATRTRVLERDRVEFTPAQLVHNLLQDRFSRYGFPLDGLDDDDWTVEATVVFVRDKIVRKRSNLEAVLSAHLDDRGVARVRLHTSETVPPPRDAAVIFPIGSMVQRIAVDLYAMSLLDNGGSIQ
jgi:hypothetical protein